MRDAINTWLGLNQYSWMKPQDKEPQKELTKSVEWEEITSKKDKEDELDDELNKELGLDYSSNLDTPNSPTDGLVEETKQKTKKRKSTKQANKEEREIKPKKRKTIKKKPESETPKEYPF